MEINLKDRVALFIAASGAIGRRIRLYLNRADAKVIGACVPSDVAAVQELQALASTASVNVEMAAFDASDFDSTRVNPGSKHKRYAKQRDVGFTLVPRRKSL